MATYQCVLAPGSGYLDAGVLRFRTQYARAGRPVHGDRGLLAAVARNAVINVTDALAILALESMTDDDGSPMWLEVVAAADVDYEAALQARRDDPF